MEVRCRIKMLAFSAHADLRGLLGLVRRTAPGAVVLVHGQREPMEFLRYEKGEGEETDMKNSGQGMSYLA